MELFLNLLWLLLSAGLLAVWFRICRSSGTSRLSQIAALLLIVVILFPIISLSDDLLFADSPDDAPHISRRSYQFLVDTITQLHLAALCVQVLLLTVPFAWLATQYDHRPSTLRLYARRHGMRPPPARA